MSAVSPRDCEFALPNIWEMAYATILSKSTHKTGETIYYLGTVDMVDISNVIILKGKLINILSSMGRG